MLDVEAEAPVVWWLCLLDPGLILSHARAAAFGSSRGDFCAGVCHELYRDAALGRVGIGGRLGGGGKLLATSCHGLPLTPDAVGYRDEVRLRWASYLAFCSGFVRISYADWMV